MFKRTNISPILIPGAGSTPSPRRGEGWGEGARRSALLWSVSSEEDLVPDRLQHAVGVGEHVVVPEPQDTVAVILDDRRPRSVPLDAVLPAVELDRQLSRAAGEVGDEIVDLELTDELLAFEPSAAEVVPQAALRLGLGCAQLAGDRRQAVSSQLSTPSPNPLPAGERAYTGHPNPTFSDQRYTLGQR